MSTQARAVTPAVASLLRQAAEWRLISLLLDCPKKGWHAQAAGLASEAEDESLRAAVEATKLEASEGLYHSFFGPGGPVPAREVSCHDSLQLGYLMSELACYYDAFSYQPPADLPADHVAVEAGFVGYLKMKEAYALARESVESVDISREASQRFLQEHLSVIAQPLAKALEESGVRYLALAAQALLQRVGPPRSLPILSPQGAGWASEEECVFDCGEAAAL
ncbi:MAG TPA: molecular chaperone TorD family protein [Terriglobia bacterium]|nr:molecular chaperone TorD family protein [Terriglobia bacterium]